MSKLLIDKNQYDEILLDYGIGSCCVRNKNIFYFIAHDTTSEKHPVIGQEEIEKRIVTFFRDDPEDERLSSEAVMGFGMLYCASPRKPKSQLVAIDGIGRPIIYGAGDGDFEQELGISPSGPTRGSARNIRTIGDHVYVVSGRRGVCRRIGKEQWESLCPKIGFEKTESKLEKQTVGWGFDDISGFSENELYACGGSGDLWRYQNSTWKVLEFPSNQELESICCGGDGNVYIGGQSGSIFVGRDNKWKLLYKGELSLPYKDLIWYDNKLWGTNSYGLWVLDGDKMVPADISPEIKVCAGHLSAADGVMLLAGGNGAAFHENGKWHLIFNVFHDSLH